MFQDGPTSIATLISADPAFRALEASGAPILALLGSPPQVVYGNPAAMGAFGPDPAVRLLGASIAGESRLKRLLDQLRESAAPRLERMPLPFDSGAQMVTILGRRLQVDDADPYFVLAALGVRSGEATAPATAPEDPPAPLAKPEAGVKTKSEVEAEESPRPAAPVKPPAKPKSGGVRALRDALIARHGGANARFLWKTDARNRFVEVTHLLGAVAGKQNADLLGREAEEAAAALGLGPALATALASRKSWSGVTVDWPLDEPECVAPTTLGALPIYDAARRFAGYQGYGVMQLDLARPERRRGAAADAKPAAREAARPAPEREPEAAKPPEPKPPQVKRERTNAKVVPLRPAMQSTKAAAPVQPPSSVAPPPRPPEPPRVRVPLSPTERDAFDEIARALGANLDPNRLREFASRSHSEECEESIEPSATVDEELTAQTQKQDTAQTDNAARTEEAIDANAGIESEEKREPEEKIEADVSETIEARSRNSEARERLAPRVKPSRDHNSADAEDKIQRAQEQTPPTRPTFAGDAVGSTPAHLEHMKANSEASRIWDDAEKDAQESAPAEDSVSRRAALLDVLPVGVLVTRGAAALYANRLLLDLLDYPDLDTFVADGGAERMFSGRMPIRSPRPMAARPVVVQARTGETIEVDALLQAIDWQDGPATLISLRRRSEDSRLTALAAPAPPRVTPLPVAAPSPEPIRETPVAPASAPPQQQARPLPVTDEGKAFAVAFEAIGEPAAILNEEGRIELVNTAFSLRFDTTESTCQGRLLAEFFDPTEARRFSDFFENVVPSIGDRPNGPAFGDIRLSAPNRPEGLKRLSIRRISASEILYICVIADAAAPTKEWVDAEQARKTAERESASKSALLARVSHEIRTPLNAILGFTEVMREERFGPIDNEHYHEYLRDMHVSGTHVLSLVNDLLNLSKLEAGKMELSFGWVDVNTIVAECVSLMQPETDRRRIVMRLSLASRLPSVRADARALRQILLNLLSNALKFTDPGGQVIVSSAQTDTGYVLIRVKDTGIGMTEEELQVALEPFGQVATSRPNSGTGLGLPVTKALIEANRATFKIKSRKNEGTLIEVAFPPQQEQAEE